MLAACFALPLRAPAQVPPTTPTTPTTPPAAAAGAAFDVTCVPATGTHDAVLTVKTFGRYAIAVSSSQGTALQLVDRMAGPGDISGVPGATDGRIDAFLERGTYKLHVIADPRGSGAATLSVTQFTELQAAPVALVEDKPVEVQLADHQQRSWWLVVHSRGTYGFEAGGRYLADLQIWRDGGWLIGAAPVSSQSAADPANPLAIRQLTAQLEPGTYRLTAYGGPGLPWAAGSTDAPLLLRWGVPALSDAGRGLHIASRFGTDRFVVPGTATDFRLDLDQPEAAGIAVQPFDVGTMFDTGTANTASIDKTSRDPVAELTQGPANTPWLVTITARPGTRYRLEIFNQAGTARIGTAGSDAESDAASNALLAVTLAGDADDEIDAGFLLINQGEVVDADAIDLATALPWRRHFNLLGPVSTYLYASANVDLRIDGGGAKAQFVVDRVFNDMPDHHVPDAKPSGGVWQLTPGYYILTASPLANGRGILTMSMYAAGHAPPHTQSPRLPAPLFANVPLDPQWPDQLDTSLPDGTAYGLRQMLLPATLDQPLSFELPAGAAVTIPLSLDQPGRLAVADDTGADLSFTIDSRPATGIADLPAGGHRFAMTGPARGSTSVTLTETPAALLPATALPAVPADAIAAPALPVLQPGQPVFVDLAATQSMTFALPVTADALYRFETTGLLETAGTVRTRINPSLAAVQDNGVGRNFLLEPFLRQGDYQLTVSALGATAGHAGITVSQTRLTDAGNLAIGEAARTTLAPGQAALYHFHIAVAGQYHLSTLGLGHQFNMRLEDGQGWPLIAPGGPADATMQFEPGDYRMILLPGTVANRAVTMLQQMLHVPVYAGHGPFAAIFGADMANRWMEPSPGQPRTPDRWTFSLPANATATITITPGMRAAIRPDATGAQTIATVIGNWTGRLAAGNYIIDSYSAAPDNRVDYTLNIGLAELIPGQLRDIAAPATIPVSLGGGGQYDIASAGDQDVRASLRDAAGHVVAADDDRDNDWNFLIAGNFPPGAYTLEVDPVGKSSAATEISITAPATKADPVLTPGQTERVADGLVHIIPLAAPAANALLIASIAAPVPAGLTLETSDNGTAWRQVATSSGPDPYLAVPAGTGARYRLRAWAEDHGATPLAITVAVETPPAASLAALATGVNLAAINIGQRQFGLARIAVPAPAILQLTQSPGTLQWTGAAGVPAASNVTGTIAATGPDLWLLDTGAHGISAPAADIIHNGARLTLAPSERFSLPLPATSPGGMALWTVSAEGGQPGVAVTTGAGTGTDMGTDMGDDAPARLMAATGGAGLLASAVAFQPAGLANPALTLWQAGVPAPALAVTIEGRLFPAASQFTVQTGSNDGLLSAGGAIQATLPRGCNRLALSLPAGAIAILLADGQPQSIITGNGEMPDIIDSSASALLLLNPGQAAAFSLSLQPRARPALVLRPGALLTAYDATPAILHITLQNGGAARLRIAGASTAVSAIDPAGMITTGENAQAATGGTASVAVQPGLAVVAVDPATPGALENHGQAQDVSVPGSTMLAGRSAILSIAAGPARLLHLATDVPIVLRDPTTFIPAVYPAGASVNLFQPKGQALNLAITAAGGGALAGQARFDVIPATPIGDGLGAKYLLPPGGARLFSFSLDQTRAIGVGVRGSVDDATVLLLAADGSQLGTGIVTMRTLAPGTYYLATSLPAGAAASEIQPALVGATLPDQGPPPDVVASYAALAGQPQN